MLSERINHYALLQLCYYRQCMTTKFNIITSRFFKKFQHKRVHIYTYRQNISTCKIRQKNLNMENECKKMLDSGYFLEI